MASISGSGSTMHWHWHLQQEGSGSSLAMASITTTKVITHRTAVKNPIQGIDHEFIRASSVRQVFWG